MPEGPEIETQELQEKIHEAHEGKHGEEGPTWIKYVALSTAILAVIAAIGALNAGKLVNESMFSQLKASDTWNEYQADKQKNHEYQLALNQLLDAGAVASGHSSSSNPNRRMSPADRAAMYQSQIQKENDKTDQLSRQAKEQSEESEKLLAKHELVAKSVALIQVSIALGAVAALTKVKAVWLFGLVVGLAGIWYFAIGLH